MRTSAIVIILTLLLSASAFGQFEASKDTLGQQMVGVLAATYLYQSYMNFGFLADGFEGELYDTDVALDYSADLIAVVGGARDELQAYRGAQVLEADRAFIQDLVTIADVLLQEGVALQAYIRSGSRADAQRYEEFNELARKAIQQLLGVEGLE